LASFGTLLRHLRELRVQSALVEENYLDRDFTEAYSAYYAKTFRRHTKLCTRIIFFAVDVSFVTSAKMFVEQRKDWRPSTNTVLAGLC
jgi:hypothetical protein